MAEWGLQAIIDTPKEYDHHDFGSFGSIDIKKEYDQALLFCFPHLSRYDNHGATITSSNNTLDDFYHPLPPPPPPPASDDDDNTRIIHNHNNYLDQKEIIQQDDNQDQQQINMSSTSKTSTQLASKLKKRKNQQKRVVVQVTAAGLSSDPWAWRKYGQKPIKGSIYPRSYYRCSSSKGCMARRQVEQSCTDSSVYILTYTAEHNHPQPTRRNSLAGINRNRFKATPAKTTTTTITAAICDVGSEIITVTKSPFHSPTMTVSASSFEDDHQVLQQPNIKEETMFYSKYCDNNNNNNNQGYSMMMPEINDEDYMVFSDDWFEGLEDLGGYNKTESSSSSSYDYSSTKQFPHVFC
ncbi:hypothetical protein SSX86_029748 [Deinandra increscens subsp. villosa]|uniref:WRKY domain-containing protein n=1 Tax=Deinandra increscens subsp. villosa TaxID=3103831 RepID=A0AAP0CD33_9ASTR